MSGDIEIEVAVKRTTDLAILVDHGGKADAWVRISKISDWCDGPDTAPGMGTTVLGAQADGFTTNPQAGH